MATKPVNLLQQRRDAVSSVHGGNVFGCSVGVKPHMGGVAIVESFSCNLHLRLMNQ